MAQLQAAAGGALHCLNLLSLIPLPLDLLCCSPPTFLPSLLPPHCSGLRDDDDDNSHSSDVRPRCSLHCPRLLWAPLSLRLACSLLGTLGIVAGRFFTSSLATTHPSPCQMTESPPPSTACELSLLGLFPVSAPHTPWLLLPFSCSLGLRCLTSMIGDCIPTLGRSSFSGLSWVSLCVRVPTKIESCLRFSSASSSPAAAFWGVQSPFLCNNYNEVMELQLRFHHSWVKLDLLPSQAVSNMVLESWLLNHSEDSCLPSSSSARTSAITTPRPLTVPVAAVGKNKT